MVARPECPAISRLSGRGKEKARQSCRTTGPEAGDGSTWGNAGSTFNDPPHGNQPIICVVASCNGTAQPLWPGESGESYPSVPPTVSHRTRDNLSQNLPN